MHVHFLLQLLDLNVPMQEKKYVDMEDKFIDLGLAGVRSVYATPVTNLATFSGLGVDGAKQVHAYIKQSILPLIDPVQDIEVSKAAESKVVEVVQADKGVNEDIFETIKGEGKESSEVDKLEDDYIEVFEDDIELFE